MNQAFANLDQEKQRRIIDVCMQEFAAHGYAQASTNRMVQAAGISKGLLFHYFGNKQDLYLHLFQLAITEATDWFLQGMGEQSADLMERILHWTKRKLEMFREKRTIYYFSLSVLDPRLPTELRLALQQAQADLTADMTARMLDGVDWSYFRPGVDRQLAVRLVVSALQALADDYLRLHQQGVGLSPEQYDQTLRDVRTVTDYLKQGLYPQTGSAPAANH